MTVLTVPEKVCTRCGLSGRESPPNRNVCRPCRQDQKRIWNAKNPEKKYWHKRRDQLKSLYGLTPADLDAMIERQGGVCAICGTNDPGGRGSWHVDHCHLTGKFRGMLCWQCNRRLGEKERPEWHALADAYLERAS